MFIFITDENNSIDSRLAELIKEPRRRTALYNRIQRTIGLVRRLQAQSNVTHKTEHGNYIIQAQGLPQWRDLIDVN